ncbi:carboxylesterase family protein [Vibrio mexicanus]|uniref:carboxylesterase family protein n=1 Tax=Vibrio mexicanus TaxID=1004326 RepID=UPI00063C7E3B|nr:carboxylesterase family protein [Vibrio mexicanus]
MKTQNTLITLGISAMLTACGGGSADSQPAPTKPEPLKPEPSQMINIDLGYANIEAQRESVVVDRQNGEQVRVNVQALKGIDYATAERFSPSQVIDLSGKVDATQFGFACPQLKQTSENQDEDCLNLNIWRPDTVQAGDDLPVYVFIHGGDFEYGASSEPLVHGDTVVAQGVDDNSPFIMISFNYRLGVLGSHWVKGENEDGNYGLGDQVRALEWVQNNVGDLGGDSRNVTVIGQGSGAMSIGLLQQKMQEGTLPSHYFQRAIMQSNPYGFEYRNYKSAKSQDDKLDLQHASVEEILAEQASILSLPNQIVSWALKGVGLSTASERTPMGTLMPFSPYMLCHKTSAITTCSDYQKQPFDYDFSVPTVIGSNADDASTMSMLPRLTFLIPKIVELLADSPEGDVESVSVSELETAVSTWLSDDENVEKAIAALKGDDVTVDLDLPTLPDTAYEAVSKLFFGKDSTDKTSELLALNDFAPHNESDLGLALGNMSQFKMMMNDMIFAGPSRQKALESEQNVTLYHFAYKPSFNVWTYNTKGEQGDVDEIDLLKSISCISGACNASELPFVFNKALKLDGSAVSPSKKDKALMAQMSRLWFSDELFDNYRYDASSDSVLEFDQEGGYGLALDWDRYGNAGDDPALSNGRLLGLQELGILANYF